MNDTVCIMGCGWLGFPLAKAFLEAGFKIRGSTTTDEKLQQLEQAGISPFKISLREEGVDGDIGSFLKGATLLVINIPPGLRNGSGEDYVKKMERVQRSLKAASVSKVVFISSTSVYGDIAGEVTEETSPLPATESGKQVLAAEQLFWNDPTMDKMIIRFGGLIGNDRHPVTRLSGKTGLQNGGDHVNLIHLDDCIQLIKTVVLEGHWNEVFNGVFPAHPIKEDYYRKVAKKKGLVPPAYDPLKVSSPSKIVKSRNFLSKKYSFFTSIY